MNAYILIDFGSTYTKLTLIDADNRCLLATTNANTTVDTNIKIGYENALKKMKEKIDFSQINILDILACSSAAGGLKMVAIGITPNYTVEAAKKSILGAGARLLKSYSYFLKEKDLLEISSLRPDIILLTGGAENGNTKYILHNAMMLTKLDRKIPIVVAGNSGVNKEISEIFLNSKKEFQVTENIMPDVNMINPEPAREVIRKIFMKQIIHAKGMEEVEKEIHKILMPTPSAVLKSAKLLAEGTEKYQGWGDVMVIDIGGATTDVHTISDPHKDCNLLLEGLIDPYIKRTVEGDLGMRYSAISLYENIGEENFMKYKGDLKHIKEKCEIRHQNTTIIFDEEEEIQFDEIMAKNCVLFSSQRHVGKLRSSYINGRKVLLQSGKDLRKIKYIIGTGGVLTNGKHPYEILKECISKEKMDLLPRNPRFFIDEKYIMSSMGILSMKNPDLAFEILTNTLKNIG
ncbi:DNA mismatch repair protein MutL [Fusobacterium necrophorum]|uniref:MutL n=2 Tax=Fusobacterium necrophorum TaxID=859 RepID=A0AB73BW33_9FUSO|nr:methylaspartate mutase accessory protein GlmL [Fusobacterium necrophorum]AYZ73381.1 DNA mismatch repair protein MutL [Fusobacterium necrophorum]AZW08622.1 DNA mismatch repair protein MutL [Fusobacterium necrophorum subsp. necrophorum]KDE63033.1 mutL [Fusobacterium necrophorum BL]KDE65222.1 mutL [Fusobacterium necrophorum BFTR-1]KDE67540.1 mutL [Fusobacterium necrophorum DJ-1]